jgi:hypothetical protein
LDSGVRELLDVRKSWADAANGALQAAHIDARIDHRTLAAQGINREPAPHIPRAVFEMERRGQRTVVAERIRQRYQARVEARLRRAAQRSPTPARASEPKLSPDELQRRSAENWRRYRAAQPKLSAEELQRQSVEKWLRYREERSKSKSQSPSKSRARTRDHDHSL